MSDLATLTAHSHPAFFGRLSAISTTAPTRIWARGDLSLLDQLDQTVNIDGSRASTAYGTQITAEFVADLARDYVTMTGTAYGINAAAARAALAQGDRLIIWQASGHGRPYPEAHRQLIDTIEAAPNTLLLTAVEPGAAPTRFRFIERSRLAALAAGTTLITEAGARSGALLGARIAHAAGRNVAAIPGPITSAASAGSHQLISDGVARLAATPKQVRQLIP